MNHRRAVLVDLHAGLEQLAVSCAPGGLGGRLIVVFSREQQADIDTAFNRRNQRASLGRSKRW